MSICCFSDYGYHCSATAVASAVGLGSKGLASAKSLWQPIFATTDLWAEVMPRMQTNGDLIKVAIQPNAMRLYQRVNGTYTQLDVAATDLVEYQRREKEYHECLLKMLEDPEPPA